MPQELSHYDASARVSMVYVLAKVVTKRTAEARAFGKMKPAVVRAVRRPDHSKDNPLEIARIAGPAASRGTPEWIPLCHLLPLTHIDVTATLCQNGVELRSSVAATAQTGVEMEALVAVIAAALTIYDMCKALDKAIEIAGIALVSKAGGDFRREIAVARPRTAKSRTNLKSRSKRGAR
jgi:cyclic pyranopterin phosphate synthase